MFKNNEKSMTYDIYSLLDSEIFVAGDVILDIYLEGQVSRISPEAPVPVIIEKSRRYVLGGAANVAANISAIGAKAFVCGRIGKDLEGNAFKKLLQENNIGSDYIIESKELPTISKTRVISGSLHNSSYHQMVRVDNEVIKPISSEDEERVLKCYIDFLKTHTKPALVISDYAKGFLTHTLIRKLIDLSIEKNIPVITDPKNQDISIYRGSTVIKPNFKEGKEFYHYHAKNKGNGQNFENEIRDVGDFYLEKSGAENIVMSLSEHGAYVSGLELKEPLRLKTHILQVSDVSGAGDTFISFIAMGLAMGLSLKESVEVGNIAAGCVCSKRGTSTVSLGELLKALKVISEETHPEKLAETNSLKRIIEDYKKLNMNVVFTNGCFDILHSGHVTYLQKAKALGDILIIGLNSDESVKRLKGDERPVNSFNDRAQVLSSLACVDFVVEFSEDTPLSLIKEIKPMTLVKGADYNFETTVGAKEVVSWGGEVKHIDLVPGRSTSRIIDVIRKNN